MTPSAAPRFLLEGLEAAGTDRRATTTGATFLFRPQGEIEVRARIPEPRLLFRLQTDDQVRERWEQDEHGWREVHLRRASWEARVRDDGTLVLRCDRPAWVSLAAGFVAEHVATRRGRALVLDPSGGFGVYPTRPARIRCAMTDAGTVKLELPLAAGTELWIGAYPPRPPSPIRAAQSIAHEGAPRPFPDSAYPGAEVIEAAARHCQVFALHAYFWEEAPQELRPLLPRLFGRRCSWVSARHVPADPERFAALSAAVRKAGMALVVYLSPLHSRTPDLGHEMQRIVSEYEVDGLYLDGLAHDFRLAYDQVRAAREALGPDRVLYLNASDQPFGDPAVHCPFVDTYADFVLRGDSGRGGLALDRFLRYAVSGHNLSNAVGLWCHYGSSGGWRRRDVAPPDADVEAALRNHARLWRRSVWGAGLDRFDASYYPRLREVAEAELAAWGCGPAT